MEPAENSGRSCSAHGVARPSGCLLAGHAAWFIPVTASAAHTHGEDADNTASRSNAFAAFRPIARILTRIDLAISAGDRQADLSRPRLFPGTITIFTRAVLIKTITMDRRHRDRRNQDGPLREAGTAGATHAF
jgi:hypothetical protein